MSKGYYQIATGGAEDNFYDLPAPSMTEPGDMLIVSAVRGELPPPPDGWQAPQHRARIYDAPRLSKTWTFRSTTIDFDAIPSEVLDRLIDDIRRAVSVAVSVMSWIEQVWYAPVDPRYYRKRSRNNLAFAERHARHVERRRARIVGQLGRVDHA